MSFSQRSADARTPQATYAVFPRAKSFAHPGDACTYVILHADGGLGKIVLRVVIILHT